MWDLLLTLALQHCFYFLCIKHIQNERIKAEAFVIPGEEAM